MSLHVFASFITHLGTAANNRGETEGNTTTLQKIIWDGQPHTTVSAESIRFALRRELSSFEPCNRTFDEKTRTNHWQDGSFRSWDVDGETFVDDDLLGFMSAEGAKEEQTKGSTKVRRAVLEVTRAVSLTPWSGDVVFSAASPGATPSAAKKGVNPVPYSAEVHATRYQYGIAMTPERLNRRDRARTALKALTGLGPVAGNHGRFLFDFSPQSMIVRITHDPAPRILYCFQDRGSTIGMPELMRKVRVGDLASNELIIGGAIVTEMDDGSRAALTGAELFEGVKAATEAACERLDA